MPQCENCTKFWKFVTPQLMVFLNLWFFAGIRWGGSNRESWRTSRGEHADERIRKSHLQVLRSFGIKWDFKWGTSASSSKNSKKNLDLSILNSHYPFIDAAPWRKNFLISLPSKLCLLWHFFCTRVHATPLKNSLFLSFKTRI